MHPSQALVPALSSWFGLGGFGTILAVKLTSESSTIDLQRTLEASTWVSKKRKHPQLHVERRAWCRVFIGVSDINRLFI